MTAGEVSVTGMRASARQLGRRVTPPGDRLMRPDSRVTLPSTLLTLIGEHVMPLESRVAPPGNSGAVGALAGMMFPRNAWLRAPVVEPLVGV